MENQSDKPSYFTRGLIIAFSLFLAVMAGLNFLKSTPPFSLSTGLITIIAIITVVILSESFNNLSIGQLLIISRKVKDAKEENEKLSKENERLTSQIIQTAQIAANIKSITSASSSANPSFVINNGSPIPTFTVGPATESQKDNDDENELETKGLEGSKPSQINKHPHSSIPPLVRNKIRKEIEWQALEKYIRENTALSISDMQRDITFKEAFQKIDPVMERVLIFDGYIMTSTREYFFVVKVDGIKNNMFWDRLYMMLVKVFFYRQVKGVGVDVTLINIEVEEEFSSPFVSKPERFYQAFQPAIANNLLKVENVKLSKEEYEDIRREVEKEITQTESKRNLRTK